MKRYLVILGRKTELAYIELQTVLRRTLPKKQPSFIRLHHTVVVRTKQVLDLPLLQRTLGGTVKIGLLGSRATTRDFMEKLTRVLRNEAIGKPKLTFGISIVGNPHPNQRFLIPRELKDRLAKEGIVSRYVLPTTSDELTSAQVALGGVTELYLIWTDKEVEIAKTVSVQDFEGFAKRDYQRPYVNPRSGMLPPKIARQMVNLAFPRPPSKDSLILDPFCGTGTIAMEAMMLDINTINSDQNHEQVEGTKKNLSWLARESGKQAQWKVAKADATKVAEAIDLKVDAIVTEPFLGPPNLIQKKVKNLIKGLNKLYLGAIKNWKKCLKPGGRVVLVIPEIHMGELVEAADLIIDRRENLGYTLVAGPLDYEREDAVVRRRIYVLERQ